MSLSCDIVKSPSKEVEMCEVFAGELEGTCNNSRGDFVSKAPIRERAPCRRWFPARCHSTLHCGGGTLFGWDTAHYTTGAQMGGGTLFGWDTQTEEVQDCQLSTALLFDCHLIHFCN